MFISSSASVVDMSNVINQFIYSSVENGRFKLKNVTDTVTDRERRHPFSAAPPPLQKKNPFNLGFYKLQKAPFQALDFDIFLKEHDPGPL